MRCPSDGSRPLRVGIVDYLNSRPLAWSFLSGRSVEGFEARFLAPAGVAKGLAEERLDVGLVPSIELQRIADLRVVPGLCVAATREVRSVLLVSRVPAARIDRLALDENSRTSAILVRILLREHYEVDPSTTSCRPDVESMLSRADAALVIGDPALTVDRSRYRVYDLAAEWRRLTGKPFVFAVWSIRRGFELGERLEIFRDSLELGLQNLDDIIAEAVAQQSLAEPAAREYLTENLSYRLGPDELDGLREFFERAHAHDLIPEVQPIRFASSCRAKNDSVEYDR